MDIYTQDSSFNKQEVIDSYTSAIWTERYFGDDEFVFNFVPSPEILTKLAAGTLIGCEGSDIPMIVETHEIDDNGSLVISGTSLVPWLNNRYIMHLDGFYMPQSSEWINPEVQPPEAIRDIVYNWCCSGSPYLVRHEYLSGYVDPPTGPWMGVPYADTFIVPGLFVESAPTADIDGNVFETQDISAPFGGVYDAIKPIAETYGIGLRIHTDGSGLAFQTYIGVKRTSDQTANPVVQFSPDMDSLANIKELHSVSGAKNMLWAYAPVDMTGAFTGDDAKDGSSGAQEGSQSDSVMAQSHATWAGEYDPDFIQRGTGFGLRVGMVIADNISPEMIDDMYNVYTSPTKDRMLAKLVYQRAKIELARNSPTTIIDGEALSTSQYTYGVDYNLGDILEVKGHSSAVGKALVTEYIRAQDEKGEVAHPTFSPIG